MDFDHRAQRAPTTGDAATMNAFMPGKRTLTESLVVPRSKLASAPEAQLAVSGIAASAPAPLPGSASSSPRPTLQMLFGVQRASDAAPTEDPAQVHAAAARGTATPASKLPYGDQIQRAFGRHDVSGIQAHVGSDAAASAREMSARAYATGDHVVLGEGADLHTVAHEAAHVLQQRGAVQLKGGVGEAGDAYERHADEVADRVVAGESVETMLDTYATGSTSSVHHSTQLSVVQRRDADPASSPREIRRAQVLAPLLVEWRAAGLLDAPFRPADVAPFPDLSPPPTGTIPATNSSGPAMAGAAPALAPAPAPAPVRPPLRVIPGGGGAPSPTPRPVLEPPPIPAKLLGIAVFLAVLLWPTETAPPWMDEINPITGGPYGSPEEYEWTRRLTEQQWAYLRHLMRMRDARPDAALDGEGDPYAVPAPAPAAPRDPEEPEQCKARPVPRRGGHARHNAYATKVTGSPDDYYVRSGAGLAINYDGLQTGTANVWEVKVGFGWFFNPGSAGTTAATLARWDAQKNLGTAVAASCGYHHLWAHPDRYVVQLLISRWGGIPPVVNIPG